MLTLKIPSIETRFSVSEAFAFASVLLFGPDVGVVTLALDGIRISFRWKMNLVQTVFNSANLGLAMWAAGYLFFAVSGAHPLYLTNVAPPSSVLLCLGLMTAGYYAVNSGLIAAVVGLSSRRSMLAVWREHYLKLFPSYAAGAAVAMLLVLAFREVQFTAIALSVPFVLICYLTLRSSFGRLQDAKTHVEQLNRLLFSTVETLATAIDAKDEVTHDHVRRVQQGTMALARAMGVTDPQQLQAIEAAALLHDTGKIAVPEHILNKPGKLTPAEFEKMKRHAPIGAEILSSIDFPYPVVPIVRHHHENWDGTGYPDRLRGTEIPLGARILSVVDCYDALTSDRPYRPKLTSANALRVIVERRGTMYDPLAVATYAEHLERLGESVIDLGPESETLRQIAELNNPAAIAALQASSRLSASSINERSDAYWLRPLSGTVQTEDLAALMLGRASGRMPANGCAVSLLARDGATLFTSSTAGLVPNRYAGVRTDLGRRISGWVASTRATAVNSPAVLDLDDEYGTGGLVSSLVCPLIDGDELYGVVAFYADKPDAFTGQNQTDAESLATVLVAFIKATLTGSLPAAGGILDSPLEALLSQSRGIQGWLPVGIIVTGFNSAPDSWVGQQMIPRMLRGAVRAEDFLLQIERNTFLLLLLRSNDEVTSGVASRLRDQFGMANIRVEVDWASVITNGSTDHDSRTAVADAIRRKAKEASERAFGVTH